MATKKAVAKQATPKKQSSEPLTGTDCFNHLVTLDGKKVTIHKTGEVVTAKTDAEALAAFSAAVSNSQFQ